MKYGFVYIWFDKKHRRYYVGSHWGTEDDGYICSSRWMRKAYRRRPQDFKRRTIVKIDDRRQLLEVEGRFLAMMKPEEIGKRYYNLNIGKRGPGHWSTDEEKRLSVGQKISKSRLNMSEESRNSYRKRNMKQYVTDEMREKCRAARAKQVIKHSEETKEKIRIANKLAWEKKRRSA